MSPQKIIITILYKRTQDLTFNLDYYLTHHIPFAKKIWGPHGMTRIAVTEADPSSDFAIKTVTEWTGVDAYEAAKEDKKGYEEVMGDVKNVTNGEPIFVLGKVLLDL